MLAFPVIYYISTSLGLGPALLSIFIWAYGLSYFYFEPLHTMKVTDPYEIFNLGFFIIIASILSWMVELSKRREEVQKTLELRNREKAFELERINQLKDQFVNVLSHDLKSPLNVAMMNTRLISRNINNPEKIKVLTSKTYHSLKRINNMLSDLLDSRSISAGNPLNITFSKFDIIPFLVDVVEDYTSMYGNRFKLNTPGKLEVTVSENYILRAVENLINNALKYGSKETQIEIGVQDFRDHFELWVLNHGKTLSQEEIKKIQEPFTRVNADRSIQGWGIGLSLINSILEGHKGKLEITSDPVMGTKFNMCFPHDEGRFLQV